MVKNHAASDLDNLLAEILAFEQTEKCLGRMRQTLGHGFTRLELSAANQLTEFFQSDRPIGGMFADDEALYLHAVDQNQRRVGHRYWVAVVAGDHAADRNAAEMVHAQHDSVKHHAADVFKMTVNAVWTDFFQGFGQRQIIAVQFVIDAGIKAEFVGDVIAFVFAACDTNDAATACFGQCAKRLPTAPLAALTVSV